MNHKAMTSGPIARQIFLFTLPIMAGTFLQQLYNTVDGIIVGQFIGQEALASVGTCAPLTIFYVAFAVGFSTGASILISQYYGAGRDRAVKRAVSTSLILLSLIGLAFSVVGGFIAGPILKYILAVPAQELPAASAYFAIYCAGLIFQFIYNIVAAILRSFGDSRATLYFLLVSSVVNMILDYVFIALLGWGVPGAAWATIIAQAISALVSCIYMFLRYPALRLNRQTICFDRQLCGQIVQLGLPSTLQQCVVSSGHIAIQRLVNSFGVAFMSGFTAGARLESYLIIPAIGFSTGLSTFTGQNVGAKEISRVREGLHKVIIMTALSCIALSSIAWIFAPSLVAFFGVSGESLTMGITYLRLVAPFFVIFAIYQAYVGLLQGSGDVMFTTFCTLSSLGIRVVISYLLVAFTDIQYQAIPYAMPIGWTYVLILVIWRYKKEKWLTKSLT